MVKVLMIAVKYEQIKIVDLLSKFIVRTFGKKKLSKTNRYGETALHVAFENLDRSCSSYKEISNTKIEIALLLIDNGIDVNIKCERPRYDPYYDDISSTALYFACIEGQVDVVKKLISHDMIKDNIDTCHYYDWRRKTWIFAWFELIKKLKIEDCEDIIDFIVDVGIKKQNKGLQNIVTIKNREQETVLDYLITVE